jgi:hypothetical protein
MSAPFVPDPVQRLNVLKLLLPVQEEINGRQSEDHRPAVGDAGT